MIRVLCLHNARHRASYRYRVGQFLPYWREYGIDMEAICISGREYISVLKYFFRFQHYDFILLQKKILPTLLIKRIAKKSRLVYDFDDAIYCKESFQLQSCKPVRTSTIRKLTCILQQASHVFAGSGELVSYAAQFAASVHLVPTALEQQISEAVVLPHSEQVTIGWIGNNVNLFYLSIIDEALLIMQQQYPSVRFAVMCANPPEGFKTQWEFTPWSSATEKSWLQSIDIGIMPLTDDGWSRGKCAFKLLQYMAMAKPVVASDVGANTTAVSNSVNGYLAKTSEEWIQALERLITDRERRNAMGRESLRIFTEQFERRRIQKKIADILHDPEEVAADKSTIPGQS